MDNHFGKGLMAGLNASSADSARSVANFCADYKRGFVLGFSHRMFEKRAIDSLVRGRRASSRVAMDSIKRW